MIEFRKTLPAYKEKDALLKAVSANQVNRNSSVLFNVIISTNQESHFSNCFTSCVLCASYRS